MNYFYQYIALLNDVITLTIFKRLLITITHEFSTTTIVDLEIWLPSYDSDEGKFELGVYLELILNFIIAFIGAAIGSLILKFYRNLTTAPKPKRKKGS